MYDVLLKKVRWIFKFTWIYHCKVFFLSVIYWSSLFTITQKPILQCLFSSLLTKSWLNLRIFRKGWVIFSETAFEQKNVYRNKNCYTSWNFCSTYSLHLWLEANFYEGFISYYKIYWDLYFLINIEKCAKRAIFHFAR